MSRDEGILGWFLPHNWKRVDGWIRSETRRSRIRGNTLPRERRIDNRDGREILLHQGVWMLHGVRTPRRAKDEAC